MKKITQILGSFLIVFLVACEGPQGPPGFDGFDGQDGLDGAPGIQGQVLEIDGVNFGYNASTNLYNAVLTYADFTNFEVFESDAILVYRYDGSIQYQGGTTANAWSLIPQNFFLTSGTIQYTVAHTFIDLELFIDGNFDLSNLDPGFTQNQFFRIVILPSEFAKSSKMDKSNIEAVMKAIGATDKDVQKIELN
jgi:hypothetical protein